MRRRKSVLLATVLTLSTATPVAAASPADAPTSTVPACAWEPLGYQTSHVAYPDTNARY
ncbi:hypothetical protein ACIG54_12410 [Streptomyces achromogenes]|uniref:hypothetical protein n=1 Tax=Streptomyces achromogenes TaxID=67255 RepID=UPI0037CEE5AA